jgi:hypothetical protein
MEKYLGETIRLKPNGPGWEPFLALRRFNIHDHNILELPRYHEGFVGRYFNKVSFVTNIRAEQPEIYTLRREFMVHVPHKLTTKVGQTRSKMFDHMLRVFFNDFKERLLPRALENPAMGAPLAAGDWYCAHNKSNADLRSQRRSDAGKSHRPAMLLLNRMGFSDQAANIDAISQNNGNMTKPALSLLAASSEPKG